MLTSFGPEIWILDGPEVMGAAGFHYPTRMAVIRLPKGGLVIWSPTALSDGLRDALTALGEVAHIIAPNSLHHTFVADWAAAFPEATLYGAPGLAAVRPDIAFDVTLGDTAPEIWDGALETFLLPANKITTEVVFYHPASRSVIVTDLLQQLPKGWYSGWRALVARLDLMVTDAPAVPRKFRLAFRDRAALRAVLRQLLSRPITQVLMAHGTPVRADGAAVLRRAFAWLKL